MWKSGPFGGRKHCTADNNSNYSHVSLKTKVLSNIILGDETVSFSNKSSAILHILFNRIGFHACVWIFAVKTVKDTQCGFKVP